MPIPSLLELLTPVPVTVIFDQSLGVARDLGLPETAWQPVSIGREVIYINSQIAANFSLVMQSGVAAGGFLTYAAGEWLTLCADEIFDTQRIDDSSATGKIGLSNSNISPYNFGVGDLRVLNETSGKTYTNQTSGTVPSGGSLDTTDFIADEPGAASNLTSTDVLSLVTTVPGVQPHFVDNLIGQDEESDPALRIRARQANAKASPNGPGDAYEYYAKTTLRPDGSNVGVTRTNKTQGNGTVTLYLADADGALTTTDRGYVFDNVNKSVVPTGFTLIIPDPSCTELTVAFTVTLTPNPQSTASRTVTEANIRAAVLAYFASIPIGGVKAQSFQGMYVAVLTTIVLNAAGDAVLNAVVNTPASDVTLFSAQIPVLGAFTVVWTT